MSEAKAPTAKEFEAIRYRCMHFANDAIVAVTAEDIRKLFNLVDCQDKVIEAARAARRFHQKGEMHDAAAYLHNALTQLDLARGERT